MGEIIDHRYVTGADVPSHDLGARRGPAGLPDRRSATSRTRPRSSDPDRTGSPLYVKEPCCGYPDGGRRAHQLRRRQQDVLPGLAGRHFNGQTITGIDAGDATLTKSAKLWLLVDQSLSSGSDYADLGVGARPGLPAALSGTRVMTAAQLHRGAPGRRSPPSCATTPVNNPQPADATATCPAAARRGCCFDSETGTPATKFTAGAGWSRNGVPGLGPDRAHRPGRVVDARRRRRPAANSAGRPRDGDRAAGRPARRTCTSTHWRLLDYGHGDQQLLRRRAPSRSTRSPRDAAALPWVNGPTKTIIGGRQPGQRAGRASAATAGATSPAGST